MRGVQDGHLYEFHYQEKELWFGKQVMQSLLPRFVMSGSEVA
jgi:nuclear pore complex protein Nup155